MYRDAPSAATNAIMVVDNSGISVVVLDVTIVVSVGDLSSVTETQVDLVACFASLCHDFA